MFVTVYLLTSLIQIMVFVQNYIGSPSASDSMLPPIAPINVSSLALHLLLYHIHCCFLSRIFCSTHAHRDVLAVPMQKKKMKHADPFVQALLNALCQALCLLYMVRLSDRFQEAYSYY